MARDFYFSMGAYTPANTNKTWNHINWVDTVTTHDVVDDAGSATAIDFRWSAGPTSQSTSGVNSTGSGDAAWVDEAGISKDFVYVASSNPDGTLELSGLDNSKTYNLIVYASWNSGSGNRRTEISLDAFATAAADVVEAQGNTSNVASVLNVSPSSGIIELTFRPQSPDTFAHFNAMHLHENDAGGGGISIPVVMHHLRQLKAR